MAEFLCRFRRWAGAATALAAASLLAACGGGGGGGGMNTGTLNLSLTDSPACGYDAVNVTIQKVRVNQSSTASDTDAGWSEVVLSPAKRVDLLSLQNGVLAALGQTVLTPGTYTQMRLVLAPNDNANPLANSVVPTGGTETALTTPSGTQTGLKLNIDITIQAGTVADFVLDFNACRSVVKAGNSGQYLLKPVVSVIPNVSVAVIGFVSTQLTPATTSISAQQGGVPVKSTTPDSTGKFVLSPLAAGTYDIVVASAGHATATVTGVPVTSTAGVTLNSAMNPISPPASVEHTASGHVVVTPTPSSYDAVVVAQKTYTGGPTVEVAGGPVDATTGSFSETLPAGAPVLATYTAGATSLSFTADSATPTGKYTLVATSGGVSKTQNIDVSTADLTALTFNFP